MKNRIPRHPVIIKLVDELNERNARIERERSFPELEMTAEEILEELE